MKKFILFNKMPSHLAVKMALLVSLCIYSGCQSLILQTPPVNFASIRNNNDLSLLKETLKEDSWSGNKDWTNDWMHSARSEKTYYHNYRWRYSGTALPDQIVLLSEIQSGIIENKSQDDVNENKSDKTKTKKTDAGKKLIKPSKSPLYQLAQEDSLVGWNASIFLAFSNPEEAQGLKDKLKEIATTKVKYDSSDLMKIRDPKKQAKEKPEQKKKSSFPGRLRKSIQVLISDKDISEKDEDQNYKTDVIKPESKNRLKSEQMDLSNDMKLAALNAWCFLLSQQEETPVEGLAEAGLLLESKILKNGIRDELYRIVAQWVPVNDIPELNKSFEDRYLEPVFDKKKQSQIKKDFTYLRLASLEACLVSALCNNIKGNNIKDDDSENVSFEKENWPENISICSYDDLAKIRSTYGKWVVSVQHPASVNILKTQLSDNDVIVRDSAIFHLGLLKTEEAKHELEILAKENKERARTKAVQALSNFGVNTLVPFANDTSYTVRKAVAEGLRQYPSVESALLQHHFIVDRHPEVQIAATNAIHDWPVKYSIPIWGHGFSKSLRATRRVCARMLIQSGKGNEPLSFDLPQEKRIEQINSFARKHDYSLTLIGLIGEKKKPESSQMDFHAKQEIFTDLNALVNRPPESPFDSVAMKRLKNQSSNSVPIIEEYLSTASYQNSSIIFQEILPELDPVYKTLRRMEQGSVHDRRKAAQELARIGSGRTLSKMAVRRLRILLEIEQDKLIWRYSMNSIMNDTNEEIILLAKVAGYHQWADIRIMGCQYAIKHPDSQYANWLLPLLHDPDRTVQLAAIQAAGKTGNSILIDGYTGNSNNEPTPGLVSLLREIDDEIRFAATISLCYLHSEQGYRELIRQGSNESSKVREKVARAMGETKQSMFVDHLIQIAWTEDNDNVKRAILSSLDQIVPEEQRDPELKEQNSIKEKIEIWAKWNQSPENRNLTMKSVPVR